MKTIDRRNFIKRGAMTGALVTMDPLKFAKILKPDQPFGKEIFIFSKHLQWLDYADMAKMARQLGFDGVDITVRPGGHVLPENVERDLPKAVEAITKEGLIADRITTAITGPKSPHTEKILKTAATLGVKQYRMGWIQYNSDLDIPSNLKNFEQQLQALAQMNSSYGIRGDYQNHAGTSLGAALWDIWHVLKALNSKWLGIRYDIRHAVVEGTQSWPLTLKTVAPFVRSLDIKDFKWQNNADQPVINTPVGEGVVDFDTYISLLDQYHIEGDMTMHFEYPLGGAEHGKKNLTIKPDIVLKAIKKDLQMMKSFMEA